MEVFNEYIHVHATHKLENKEYMVTYEPTDHAMSRLMAGVVYKGNSDPNAGNASFGMRNPEEHPSHMSSRLAFDSNEISRGYIWADGIIEIAWKKDPGEHFLAVSYRTSDEKDKYEERNKNWLQEGF